MLLNVLQQQTYWLCVLPLSQSVPEEKAANTNQVYLSSLIETHLSLPLSLRTLGMWTRGTDVIKYLNISKPGGNEQIKQAVM